MIRTILEYRKVRQIWTKLCGALNNKEKHSSLSPPKNWKVMLIKVKTFWKFNANVNCKIMHIFILHRLKAWWYLLSVPRTLVKILWGILQEILFNQIIHLIMQLSSLVDCNYIAIFIRWKFVQCNFGISLLASILALLFSPVAIHKNEALLIYGLTLSTARSLLQCAWYTK